MKKEYEFLEKIMGTDVSVCIVCENQKNAGELSTKIFNELRIYEQIFSRFIPDSELSLLNDKKEAHVSDVFIEALREAKNMFTETQGFFNPLLQISHHGYTRSFELLDTIKDTDITKENYNIDFDLVVIDTKNNKVILAPDQRLDFGGFLKGFLAEKIARKYFTASKEIQGIIINIGGDMYTMGTDEHNQVFTFSIYNPITDKEDLSVPLCNTALATSGTYKRKWKKNGQDFHHLLDISGTKNPDTENVSVSIINQSGAKADAYTKLFLSATVEQAMKIVTDDTKYILITNKGEIIQNIE